MRTLKEMVGRSVGWM